MKKESMARECIYKSFKLMLEKKKYDEISVCDICEKAGVSRMTFYRNFNSKDDLTIKALDILISKLHTRINSLGQINHYLILKEVFETFKPFSTVINSFENSNIVKDILAVIAKKLKDNIQTDYINKTSKYIPIFFFSGITSTLFEWLKDGTKESSEDMARIIVSVINFASIED